MISGRCDFRRFVAGSGLPWFEDVVSDLDVSRHHAELRATDTGSYQIVDLGSHNGIFVNGRRVPSAVLADSDIVRLGNSTFRFARGELRQLTGSGEGTFAQDEPIGPDT